MIIIGINAFHGDSSACLFVDGEMQCAVEEERFRRIKHWAGFPSESIKYCLESNKISLSDVDVVAINSDPKAARFKKLAFLATGQASLELLKEKLTVREKRKSIREWLAGSFPNQEFTGKIEQVEHHHAHLASAYLMSPFQEANVLSVDGFGDFSSTAWGIGTGSDIQIKDRVYFPHSLGIFYQAMTQFLGFRHYGDEYKVMGLAPYGKNTYQAEMDQVLNTKHNGLFKLNLQYFQHHKKSIGYEWENGSPIFGQLYSKQLEALFGQQREPDQELAQKHKDIAHSIQNAYERTFFHILNKTYQANPVDSITLAGGCGMNSVANGKLHLHTPYKNVYVQSAAGDAGGAIGAAVVAGQRHQMTRSSAMTHSYWGPSFSNEACETVLKANEPALEQAGCQIELSEQLPALCDVVSNALIDGKVVGWFQGAMEWGPRALGNRSILGDPRRSDMKDILNLKIKRRESFRPFAPSVLREHVPEWFESDGDVPFMMRVFQIEETKRNQIPAVTHVDGSGRLQTVSEDSNARYYHLINAFYEKTGVPMLLNTSFNENEPVVCTPEEALACFLRTNMDMLVLGDWVVQR